MIKCAFLFLFLISMIGCEYNDIGEINSQLNGSYKGYFIRTNPYAKYAAISVNMTFEGNRFSGSSSLGRYPAICSGTFKVKGNKVDFSNECAWTADFDWSYILSGEFELEVDEKDIKFTKFLNGNTDIYSLTRQ